MTNARARGFEVEVKSEATDFTFVETISRTFYLNGKRYDVRHEQKLSAGKYKLVRLA